jgi:hypothetical protein
MGVPPHFYWLVAGYAKKPAGEKGRMPDHIGFNARRPRAKVFCGAFFQKSDLVRLPLK